eukprot:NODE_343_length_9136_cov_0.948656.p3 type:complete len:385 gc:universal NODE_343_length_9136_cov_0.948656:5063-3909(-)
MLLAKYSAFFNSSQYILNINVNDRDISSASGILSIDNYYMEFGGYLNHSQLSAYVRDSCSSHFRVDIHDPPSTCHMKIFSCDNSTIDFEMNGYSQYELKRKSMDLLEFGLYAILVCLFGSFVQFRSMSELRSEKIVAITFQFTLVLDVLHFYFLLNIESVYDDTRAALLFYLGMHLFFMSRLVIYMEKSWFLCCFWGSMLYISAKVHPLLAFAVVIVLIFGWIKQVWYCFYEGITPGFTWPFLLSNFARLYVALYVWGCPKNIVNFGNHHYQGFVLLALVFLISVLLALQYFHPRFYIDQIPILNTFLIKKLKPTHNYISELEADDETTCGICLEELREESQGYQLLNRIMRAPCDHVFHERCLQEWLKVKLQCPTCRKELPPI